mgnify:CR=1 FL=1
MSASDAITIEEVCRVIGMHADQIAGMFDGAKVSIFVRCESMPDADVLVSPDDADVLIAAITRLTGRLQ